MTGQYPPPYPDGTQPPAQPGYPPPPPGYQPAPPPAYQPPQYASPQYPQAQYQQAQYPQAQYPATGVQPPPFQTAFPPSAQPPGMPVFPVQAPPPRSNRGILIGTLIGGVVLILVCGAALTGVVMFRTAHRGGTTTTTGSLAGLIDYRTSNPSWLARDHQDGTIDYPMTPPAGGPHHPRWQDCMGDVYPKQIDNGNAVHSLEHGAVWITYLPTTSASDVEKLASRVRGQSYLMLSPYPGQPTAVSLQAWGYQLPLPGVYLKLVDAFIARFRLNASVEPGATCTNGTTTTLTG
jgi:hypothetical protein